MKAVSGWLAAASRRAMKDFSATGLLFSLNQGSGKGERDRKGGAYMDSRSDAEKRSRQVCRRCVAGTEWMCSARRRPTSEDLRGRVLLA